MEQTEIFDFKKDRIFKEFIPDTFQFLSTHWKSYFFYILIFAGPFIAIGAYYSSIAQLKILETQDLFSAKELFYAFFFDFLADIVINGISFGFIISYILYNDTSRETIGAFFNQNLVVIIGATVFANIFLYLGLILFIIPGVILLAPLSLYVFDKLINKEPLDITFVRCMRISQSNIALSYGIIIVLYISIFVIKQLVGMIVPIESQNFIPISIVLNLICNVFLSFTSITIAMLYFTLQNKYFKN